MAAEPVAPQQSAPDVIDLPVFSAVGSVVLYWGQVLSGLASFIGDLVIVLGKTLGFIFKGAISVRMVIAQMAFLGVDSMGIVLLCLAFTGLALATALVQQVADIQYGKEFVGGGILWVMTKELGPVLTGLILAGRAGAGMASEIGTMKVTEQIDALRATGVHPIRYLSVPRVIATVLMCPVITFCGCVVGVVAGYFSAHYTVPGMAISFNTYFDSVQNFFRWDLMQALLRKSLWFGLIVSGVAITEGFNTEGGAAGVGRSTTRAVVNAMILIFFVDMVMVIFFKV
ncbi:MAG: hypothetical protein GEEBNDBF_02074 [bacterium]|nr:hypothetical protein [bacterium]